jgi:hypothetical protein
MFVRKKTIDGKTYHYLVKSVRVRGRVQQKVLAYLGAFDNLEAAWKNATGAQRAKLGKLRKEGKQ